ncbi:hypothetical protein KR093_008285 [Drosophila rubida]|uniref:NADH dehydrogenase [ubiquinone] 1 alpha subcomplex subunit 7 n=1 Tax=Drosophila rubida TaxID=30044 RepID=A0AAD4K380_9MUSC|nr:hypothetical protein KR093_008285 [Drosophila rubida]
MPPKHRDISPFLQLMRDFLLGRKHVTCLRHADNVNPRSLPPHTPFEQENRYSSNPYYSRDARSLVRPPIDLVEQKKREEAAKALAEAAKAAAAATEAAKAAAAAAEAAKNAKVDCKKPPAAPAPKAEKKPADPPEEQSEAKGKGKEKRKVLPTPGPLHNWD